MVETELADWIKAEIEVASYRRLASDTRVRVARIRANPETAHVSSLGQVKATLSANLRVLTLLRVTGKHAEAREELRELLVEIEALSSDLFRGSKQELRVPSPSVG